ncbi:unnamed protein product [Musa acuminata var. zebrina]
MPSSKYTMKKTNSSGYLLLLVFLVLMAVRTLSIRYPAQAFLEENVYKGRTDAIFNKNAVVLRGGGVSPPSPAHNIQRGPQTPAP